MRAPAITHRPVGLNSGVYSRIVFWLTSLIGFPVFCVSRRLFAFSLSLSLSLSLFLSLFFSDERRHDGNIDAPTVISVFTAFMQFLFSFDGRERVLYIGKQQNFNIKMLNERGARACGNIYSKCFVLKATLALPSLKRFVSNYFISRRRGSLSIRNLIRTLATITSNEPRQVIYTRERAASASETKQKQRDRDRERERDIYTSECRVLFTRD